MKQIDLNQHPEIIRKFFLSLSRYPDGTVVELDGKTVAHVFPATLDDDASLESWSTAKNARRCQLIDQAIDSSLSAKETHELKQLQNQMLQYVNQLAPYQLEHARLLLGELKSKAEAALKKRVD